MRGVQGSIKYYKEIMAIKISSNGYINIRRWDLYQEKAVPTGQVREVDGEKEAEFFLISGKSDERKVWLKRTEIY